NACYTESTLIKFDVTSFGLTIVAGPLTEANLIVVHTEGRKVLSKPVKLGDRGSGLLWVRLHPYQALRIPNAHAHTAENKR
ncbi:hypothetical protein HW555_008110, partial [Spodoptera exigua]